MPASLQELHQALFESSKVKGVRNLNRRKLQQVLSEYDKINNELMAMHKSKKEEIIKARPYYKIKYDLMNRLRYQRDKVDRLRDELMVAKNEYRESMKIIEKMNEEMHQQREGTATENEGNTTEENVGNTSEENEGNTTEENEGNIAEGNEGNTAREHEGDTEKENEGDTEEENEAKTVQESTRNTVKENERNTTKH